VLIGIALQRRDSLGQVSDSEALALMVGQEIQNLGLQALVLLLLGGHLAGRSVLLLQLGNHVLKLLDYIGRGIGQMVDSVQQGGLVGGLGIGVGSHSITRFLRLWGSAPLNYVLIIAQVFEFVKGFLEIFYFFFQDLSWISAMQAVYRSPLADYYYITFFADCKMVFCTKNKSI